MSSLLWDLAGTIDRYLVGALTLTELETWLLGRLQAILDAGDAQAVDLANRVDADLVMLREELIDEAELRDRFAGYVAEVRTITIPDPSPTFETGYEAGAVIHRKITIPLPGEPTVIMLPPVAV